MERDLRMPKGSSRVGRGSGPGWVEDVQADWDGFGNTSGRRPQPTAQLIESPGTVIQFTPHGRTIALSLFARTLSLTCQLPFKDLLRIMDARPGRLAKFSGSARGSSLDRSRVVA